MKPYSIKKFVTILFLAFIIFSLLWGMKLTHEDKNESPLKEYYLKNRGKTGSENIVSGILLDYRAYDTFGEVMVLYVAITGVIILGMKSKKDEGGDHVSEPGKVNEGGIR